eukprot:3441195-Rhodomonas_salina.1
MPENQQQHRTTGGTQEKRKGKYRVVGVEGPGDRVVVQRTVDRRKDYTPAAGLLSQRLGLGFRV